MCQKGRLDDTSAYGLPDRLQNEEICSSSYYQIGELDSFDVYQGCEWLGPTDIYNLSTASPRCQPEVYCSQEYIDQLLCFPGCNCMPLRSTPCTPAQIMCCEGTECKVCALLQD